LPRNLRWGLRKLAKNDYALEVKSPELARVAGTLDRGSKRIARAISSFAFFVTGAILIQADKGPHWDEFATAGLVFLGLGALITLRINGK
jgi:hypothetical protein